MDPQQRYTLLEVLQDTLYGRAYIAEDTTTHTTRLIKVSYQRLIKEGRALKGSRVLENPLKECQIMRKLNAAPSKHVLSLVEEMNDENFHWMVLPFCKGGDFYERVTRSGFFPPALAKHYFKQLIQGVEHIHNAGYAHLDISLENLLCDEHNNLCICDFGLAQELPKKGSFVPLGTQRPGKTKYMAPEVHSGTKMDPRKADAYTMGIVLFMMLAGRPAYTAPTLSDPNFAVLYHKGLRALLEHQGHSFPEGSIKLLEGLLDMNPNTRFGIEEMKKSAWLLQ